MTSSQKPDSSLPVFTDPNARWLTVGEAALRSKCPKQLIRKLIHDGELKALRIGPGYTIDVADLDALLVRRKQFFKPYRRNTHPWVTERWKRARRRRRPAFRRSSEKGE